jgi:hypothetical protein
MTLLRVLRRVGVVLAIVSLAFAVVATVVRWRGARQLDRAVADFTARVGPVTTASYNLPPVNPATNPAPPLRRASELLGDVLWQAQPGQTPTSSRLRALAGRPADGWTPDERAFLEQFRSASLPARAELQRALERRGPSSFELDFTHAWDLGLPDFRALLGLGDLLLVEARQAQQAGNWAEVVRVVGDLGHLADTLRTEVPLIFQLMAYNLERRQHVVLSWVVESPAADLSVLEAAARALGDGAEPERLVRSIGGEGAFLHEVLQAPDLRASLAFTPLSRLYLWLSGDRYVAELLGYYAGSAEVLRHGTSATAIWPVLPDFGPLWSADLNGFAVHFEPLAARLAATRSTRQLAKAALALRRAGLESGSYPPLGDREASELTGEPIRRRDQTDGGVVLDLEGAAERWQELVPQTPASPPMLASEWRLPPIRTRPAPASSPARGSS